MRAILCKKYGLPQDLVFEETSSPVLLDDHILVKTKASSVNFPDILLIQGKYQFRPAFPFSPGGDISGIVKTVGKKVTKFKVGDEVFGVCRWGGFAEEVAILESRCFKKAGEMTFQEAAALSVAYGTSIHALKDRAKLQQGETLLVLGAAGGCGLAAVGIGKAMGAKVIAAASSAEKLEICKAHGADLMVNYNEVNLKETIKQLTKQRGVDVIFDPVGGIFSEQALRTMAWNGRHLVIGFTSGQIPKIPLNIPLLKSCQIVGVFWGIFTQRQSDVHTDNMNILVKWFRNGQLKPFIQAVYPLEKVPEALQVMMDRKVKGKIVIEI